MAAVAGTGLPTLSQILAWDLSHLEQAETDWMATARLWEQAFEQAYEETRRPGGTPWSGRAADVARASTGTDLQKVRGWCDALQATAITARRGVSTLSCARRQVLDAVDDAHARGYTVTESLLVLPPSADPASAAQALRYTDEIVDRVLQLLTHDRDIAAQLISVSAPLDTVTFGETPVADNGRVVLVDNVTDGDPSTPAPQEYTTGPFTPTGIEEGGSPGFDPGHNAQGIRGDEGVIINDGRILFGDTAELGNGTDTLPYIDTPMYDYTLDDNGMPILHGAPVHGGALEQGIPRGTRIIPTGSTGPDGMPNGTDLLFGKPWAFGDGVTDPPFPTGTLVFDTSGAAPFPQVAQIPGITDVSAVFDPASGGLIVSGMQGETRSIWLTPAQSAIGDYSFLNPTSWTPVGGVASHSIGEPTASMFRIDTPTGPMFGLISPSPANDMDLRLSPTAFGLASAAPTTLYNAPGLYSPNITRVAALPDGGYDVAMTFSQRLIDEGVPPSQLGRQTYQNIFGHFAISPS